MTEEVGEETAGMSAQASERYEVVVTRAPLLEWGVRCLVALVAEVVVASGGLIAGGERISVRERGSGETVARFKQRFGNENYLAHDIQTHLGTLTVDEFECRWVKVP